mmetsp:Transcript_14478/g.31487  ORF Transcript_14478/g.31487 Transcript_14478/m.31487 type:complete len:246 (-) Transcript_14478:2146-2883(-)
MTMTAHFSFLQNRNLLEVLDLLPPHCMIWMATAMTYLKTCPMMKVVLVISMEGMCTVVMMLAMRLVKIGTEKTPLHNPCLQIWANATKMSNHCRMRRVKTQQNNSRIPIQFPTSIVKPNNVIFNVNDQHPPFYQQEPFINFALFHAALRDQCLRQLLIMVIWAITLLATTTAILWAMLTQTSQIMKIMLISTTINMMLWKVGLSLERRRLSRRQWDINQNSTKRLCLPQMLARERHHHQLIKYLP